MFEVRPLNSTEGRALLSFPSDNTFIIYPRHYTYTQTYSRPDPQRIRRPRPHFCPHIYTIYIPGSRPKICIGFGGHPCSRIPVGRRPGSRPSSRICSLTYLGACPGSRPRSRIGSRYYRGRCSWSRPCSCVYSQRCS